MEKEIEKNVTVVSIDNYSFQELKNEKIYAFPKNSRKINKYFAFYIGKPVSGIVYYGEVDDVKVGGKELVTTKYWLMNLANKNPPYVKLKFKNLKKLKDKIGSSGGKGGHIQGMMYTSIGKLKKAKFIDDLR